MIISSNLAAQSAANDLSNTSAALAKSLAKLSSGSRIVNAYDDAAGVAISLRFDAKIERANAARDNVANAMSFTNTQAFNYPQVPDVKNLENFEKLIYNQFNLL